MDKESLSGKTLSERRIIRDITFFVTFYILIVIYVVYNIQYVGTYLGILYFQFHSIVL